MRVLAILALLTLAPWASAADIYKHLDKHGNVVYTDQPPENAEQVTLPPANVLNIDPAAREEATRYKAQGPATKPAADEGYTSLRIAGAPEGETLQNPEDPITISAKPVPPMRQGHRLVILHNGTIANPDGGESVTIERIERGSHVFVAEIRDAEGKVLIASPESTFVVQRTSVIHRP